MRPVDHSSAGRVTLTANAWGQIASLLFSSGSLVLVFATRVPFAVVSLGVGAIGLGSGFFDATLTSLASLYDSTLLVSWTYACFSLGGCVGPLVIGALRQRGISWQVGRRTPPACHA